MARVLLVNKFWYLSGGSERYVFDWSRELARRGHEVAPFSMIHEKNVPSPWSPYFVRTRDFGMSQPFLDKARAGAGSVWSLEAARKIDALIDAFRPDVCHLHSFGYQITSSILPVLRRRGVPVVQTSHDYKLVCPNQRFYDLEKHVLCTRCAGRDFRHAVRTRCLKDSLPASLLAAIEGGVNRAFHLYDRYLDRIVAPSRFLADKLVEYGLPAGKVLFVPNFVDPSLFRDDLPVEEPRSAAYFGRLSQEKGLDTLLTAARRSGVRLHLMGTGPIEENLRRRAAGEGIDVVFHGFVPLERLMPAVARCGFVVLPSEWYENGPFAALEAMALARPLVVSRIGGLPELVVPEVSWYAHPGDVLGRDGWRLLEEQFSSPGEDQLPAAV